MDQRSPHVVPLFPIVFGMGDQGDMPIFGTDTTASFVDDRGLFWDYLPSVPAFNYK
jgi:hypothetical protein